jgi:hypothetical protein
MSRKNQQPVKLQYKLSKRVQTRHQFDDKTNIVHSSHQLSLAIKHKESAQATMPILNCQSPFQNRSE